MLQKKMEAKVSAAFTPLRPSFLESPASVPLHLLSQPCCEQLPGLHGSLHLSGGPAHMGVLHLPQVSLSGATATALLANGVQPAVPVLWRPPCEGKGHAAM